MHPRLLPLPQPKDLWTVRTTSGLCFTAYASSPKDAMSKVHDATAAWIAFASAPAANDNGGER